MRFLQIFISGLIRNQRPIWRCNALIGDGFAVSDDGGISAFYEDISNNKM